MFENKYSFLPMKTGSHVYILKSNQLLKFHLKILGEKMSVTLVDQMTNFLSQSADARKTPSGE